MSSSLLPDNFSFEGFHAPSPQQRGLPRQNFFHEARTLYEETVQLIDALQKTDTEDLAATYSLHRQLKVLKEHAKLLDPALSEVEFSERTKTEDLSQCAHHQLQQAIGKINDALNSIETEKIPYANFKRFIQGDSVVLLYIKNEKTGQYTLLGNKENVRNLIKSGKLPQSDLQTAVNNRSFGTLNLKEKVCTTCSKEKALYNLTPHANLKDFNKKAHDAIKSMDFSEFDEFYTAESTTSLIQQEFNQDPLLAFEELEDKVEHLGAGMDALTLQIKEKITEAKEKQKEKNDESNQKEKKSYTAALWARDQDQDALAAKKMRERLHDERVETKLKQRRDDDQNIETREDKSLQKGLDIKNHPYSE